MSLYDNGGYAGPAGVSVATNVQLVNDYKAEHGEIAALLWAADKMQAGGEWDYRKQGEDQGLSSTEWQDIGNFNFGAVASALGLPSYILENGGGLDQIKRGTDGGAGIPLILRPYGDDPADNTAIRAGIKASKDAGVVNGEIRIPIGDANNNGIPDIHESKINPAAKSGKDAASQWQRRHDPLTFDLDGDGLETTGIAATNPILFDHDGDGIKNGTGWVSSDDGFLVLDKNGNGSIDSGRELFGDNTIKSNGQLATDGFDALADLDSISNGGNADGRISNADAQFANLRVWRDLNQDGISQSNELFTLTQLNISSINVTKTANSQTLANGNQIADLGTFTRIDGSTGTAGAVTGNMADINLASDTFHRTFPNVLNTSSVATLPDMQGSGAVRDLREAATQSTTL